MVVNRIYKFRIYPSKNQTDPRNGYTLLPKETKNNPQRCFSVNWDGNKHPPYKKIIVSSEPIPPQWEF